ncbi:MAG: hypothetical protein ACK4GM_07875 [Tabrizicola sp.]
MEVYDEGGNWRGMGRAWALAEAGKRATIVTPEPYVGRDLERTAADGVVRRRLGALGVRMLAEHRLVRWHGNGATVRSFLTGEQLAIPASGLVMATTNRAFDPQPETMPGKVLHRIGACAAPRLAAYAFHEGRKLGMAV